MNGPTCENLIRWPTESDLKTSSRAAAQRKSARQAGQGASCKKRYCLGGGEAGAGEWGAFGRDGTEGVSTADGTHGDITQVTQICEVVVADTYLHRAPLVHSGPKPLVAPTTAP